MASLRMSEGQMTTESNRSGHWTDDQVIAHLYGVGPEDGHILDCDECRGRASNMLSRRQLVDHGAGNEVSFEFLAAQRRGIYQKLDQPTRWQVRRWVSAAAAILVVAGGLAIYQQRQDQTGHFPVKAVAEDKISDAQLAADVARMAQSTEPDPAAPLQELFEE
jgi:hypothetical protein